MKVLVIGSGGRESAIVIAIIQSQMVMRYAIKKQKIEDWDVLSQKIDNFIKQHDFLQSRLQYKQSKCFYKSLLKNSHNSVKQGYVDKNLIVDDLFCIPANPQIATLCKTENISIDNNSIKNFCTLNKIDLVVIGPEDPLANGLTDELEAIGIKVFGPSKLAARIESSKIFMKDFCAKFNIPTAKYKTFYNDINSREEIINFAKQVSNNNLSPVVIKTNGLAAGKGVAICNTVEDFSKELNEYFEGKFGDASKSIVVEEFMDGREVSFFALCDGKNFQTIGYACDHKKLLDGNNGPNTGGMGTYSYKNILTRDQITDVEQNIIKPLVDGMLADGHPYRGVIFAGLMITKDGIKLIEYNARFGDPETQAILPLIKNNFLQIAVCGVDGVDNLQIQLHNSACVNVVCVSGGYPESYKKGVEIFINKKSFSNARLTKKTPVESKNIKHSLLHFITNLCAMFNFKPQIIHCGVVEKNSRIFTNGGRVVSVRSVKCNLDCARKSVYKALKSIKFEGMYYRKDI
jgi:phosphoribosylamine--glycine ligase